MQKGVYLGLGVLCALSIINSTAGVLYVDGNSTNPIPPYATWTTAAASIQDAIDASSSGDQVLVTNGIYQTGARVVYGVLTNRVVINKPITVQSVNGPAVTVIQGYQVQGTIGGDSAVRCVYMTNGAALAGFTLTNGATRVAGGTNEQIGGGVWGETNTVVVSNCVLAGNYAYLEGGGASFCTLIGCRLWSNQAPTASIAGNFPSYGGGATRSTLVNCILTNNLAGTAGGGASLSTLTNCTVVGNTAQFGGGVAGCAANNCLISSNSAFGGGGAGSGTLNNCTLVYNTATASGGVNGGGGASVATLNNCIVYYNTGSNISLPHDSNYNNCTLNYCCAAPLPAGINFTNAPAFVNAAGNDFHLAAGSPCINAGNSAYAFGATDLDGSPRVISYAVDIGAYEYQGSNVGLSIPITWLQQYDLPSDGSANFADADGDGMNNYQEWIAGTNPTNANSALQVTAASGGSSGITLSWSSVSNRTYFVQRRTDIAAGSFQTIATNIVGHAGTTSYLDTNTASQGPWFYRVGIQ